MRRRHADVEDDGVRIQVGDETRESASVLYLGHDLHPGLLEDVNDTLARDEHILGHDHAHGSSRASIGRSVPSCETSR